MKSIILSLLLISSVAFATKEQDRVAAIEALRPGEVGILNSYLDLMVKKKLMHQEDVRLKERLLLKRDGGLCAFTAMTDSLEAMSEYYDIAKSKFEKRPDYVLYQIMEEMRDNTGIDGAHDGAVLQDLAEYTNVLLEKYGLDQIAKIGYTADRQLINPARFKNTYWRLHLVGVTSNDNKEGHTMVVIGVDEQKQMLYVSDPNYPNQATEVPYKFSLREGLRMYLNVDDFGKNFSPAYADELMELDVLKDGK